MIELLVERYDAIVIGAGHAGPALAARLGAEGLQTAIVERKLLGGTCVNVGCIPTKTLVGSARAIHMARRGSEYGFSAGGVKVDMVAVKQRKDKVVGQSSDGLAGWIAGMKNVTLLRGQARFTAPRMLDVGGRTLQAERIFINVGGRAVVPDIPGVKEVPFLTNTTMMDLDRVPEHLVIIGGSYIGLEFAQMYRRFGAKVTVIEKFDKLLPREDEDVVAEIRAIRRTSAEGVWCMGDANGKGAFTHTSWNGHEIVAANLFDNDPRKISDRIPAYALFIDPPLGRVGMNEAEAKKSGRKLLAGKMLMTRIGRAREAGETEGFMKVLVDAETKELLGAAILGLNGNEIVHSMLDVMYAKKPYTTIQRAVHIHPTVTELIPTLLGNLKSLAP